MMEIYINIPNFLSKGVSNYDEIIFEKKIKEKFISLEGRISIL